MKSLLRGLLAASVGALVLACATDYAAAPSSEIADSGSPDTGTAETDATVDRDVDAGVDAGPTNLLRNPGFESGGCDGWLGPSAELTTVAGRNGGTACRVCGVASASAFGIEQTVRIPSSGATHIRASVWTRGAGDGGATPTLTLDVSVALQGDSTPLVVRNDQWTPGANEPAFDVTDNSSVTLSIVSRQAGDPCFLVDDASLVVPGQ